MKSLIALMTVAVPATGVAWASFATSGDLFVSLIMAGVFGVTFAAPLHHVARPDARIRRIGRQ